jgi:hypothetical protein
VNTWAKPFTETYATAREGKGVGRLYRPMTGLYGCEWGLGQSVRGEWSLEWPAKRAEGVSKAWEGPTDGGRELYSPARRLGGGLWVRQRALPVRECTRRAKRVHRGSRRTLRVRVRAGMVRKRVGRLYGWEWGLGRPARRVGGLYRWEQELYGSANVLGRPRESIKELTGG